MTNASCHQPDHVQAAMSFPQNSWQEIAQRKQNERLQLIPPEWRLSKPPAAHVNNYVNIPRSCGLLSEQELRITEDFDATSLAEALRRRNYSCVEVTRAFCKRASIAHQLTNCLTEILFTDALKRAEMLDAHLNAGKPPLGPLHGVPISVKDTFKIKGYDTSIGLAALCFKPATENSILIDNLLAAGAVLYCKTNIPQTLMALDSHNNIFGRTMNPLNTAVTAGGSSGGEGALLALRGSVLGVGTDVGGSIRIPAMCNGLFGIKPSHQRIPYAGQENGTPPALTRVGLPASAGPLTHSTRDLQLFFRAVAAQKPWLNDPDVVPESWSSSKTTQGKRLRIGIVRRDGVMEPHPPIQSILSEVGESMTNAGIDTLELDISTLFKQCQSLANALFSIEGGNNIFDLLEAFDEPLSPWLQTRLRRGKPASFDRTRELHARRVELQTEFLQIWRDDDDKEIDAFICPVAPHPVPPIDKWNGVSYTSSFVLLDLPAGVIPVRTFKEKDLRGEIAGATLGSWDKVNRELWTHTERSIYLGTPLSIQVVVPRLQEERLCEVMGAIDDAIQKNVTLSKAKL